jgi:hypothetical protein
LRAGTPPKIVISADTTTAPTESRSPPKGLACGQPIAVTPSPGLDSKAPYRNRPYIYRRLRDPKKSDIKIRVMIDKFKSRFGTVGEAQPTRGCEFVAGRAAPSWDAQHMLRGQGVPIRDHES